MNKPLAFLIVLILSFAISPLAKAQSASLHLSPQQGTFYVGSIFDVSVFVNTEGNSINAVQVDLKFPPDLLQVTSPTAGSSFISVWGGQPFYSNRDGIISFKGGVPSPGINTSAGLVSTITFRVKAPGVAIISFLNTSRVLLDDGKGTDILKTATKGQYTLVIPPPEGPKVFSSTHPSLTNWYRDNNPGFFWEREQEVTDFSYTLSQDAREIPDNIPEEEGISAAFNDIGDGVWYFHIKPKKYNVWGGVTHYPVRIDTTPPREFQIKIERLGQLTEPRFFVYFSTVDLLSGVDHYELSVVDMSDPLAANNPFFMEAISPYKIPYESVGKYRVLIRAYDGAGNHRKSTADLNIVASFFSYTDKGIQIKKLFFPYWLLWLFLISAIVISIFLIRHFVLKRNIGIRLKKEVAEAEKEIEDVRKLEKKIKEMRTLEEEAKGEEERLIEKLRETGKSS